MKIGIHLLEPHNCIGKQTVHKQWSLWLVSEDGYIPSCHKFAAKPTKKQIRKLRKEFRKNLPTEHEQIIIDVLGIDI